jgi:hypothetical protein
MLPRYLGDPHVKPLPKHYLGCAWIKEILNLSAMGVASRRYTPLQLPPPDHSLHGSEWLLFTGQKPLPLAGPDVAQLVAKCLHQLEIISNVVVED